MNEIELYAYLAEIGFDSEVQSLTFPDGAHVYCLFGDDSELVYAGRSDDLLARLGRHKKQHPRVSRAVVIQCTDKREAVVLEKLLIREFQPRFNVVGTHRDRAFGRFPEISAS